MQLPQFSITTLLLAVTWTCTSLALLRVFGPVAIPTILGVAGAIGGFILARNERFNHFMPIAAPFLVLSLSGIIFSGGTLVHEGSIFLILTIGFPCCVGLLLWLHLAIGRTEA